MQTRRHFALVAGAAMLLPASGAVAADAPATTATPDPVLVQVVAGDWRTPEAKARDASRHPVEALTFWGLKPGMTILEVQPGAQSWWTEILAPYAKRTGGKFYVTGPDLVEPRPAGRRPASRGPRSRRATVQTPTCTARSMSSTGARSRRRCRRTLSISS